MTACKNCKHDLEMHKFADIGCSTCKNCNHYITDCVCNEFKDICGCTNPVS